MKAKILSLFSLLALLVVSTTILADGRPTGIRIGRLVSGGDNNVEMDMTITGTNLYYGNFSTSVWVGPGITNGITSRWQVDSTGSWLPVAVSWGDSSFVPETTLRGPPGGPFTGTFAHTYAVPGTYVVTVGDAYGPGIINKGDVPFTGNAISASTRYVAWQTGPYTFNYTTWTTGVYQLIAMTANATVSTGTGIPALNIYGLLAMSLVLVGAGLLVFHRPQRAAL